MICIHYTKKKHWWQSVHHVLLFTNYCLDNPFGKKSLQSLFLHLFNAVHRNMFRTAGTKETVSGVRCQLSGCRVGDSRAQTHNDPPHH